MSEISDKHLADRAELNLYNSLSRQPEPFVPVYPGEARVYTCGPTVYNYQHIGNMRAFLFADTLGRVLRYKGYRLIHVVNITDVGHLTSDADAGEDKMEQAAAKQQRSIWEIARYYTDIFKGDIAALNICEPFKWSVATDHVADMIDYTKKIVDKHAYQLESGLYFDTASVPDYGRLARAENEAGESRIEPVEGKRQPWDFALWRTSPPGEQRQMEWDSPWGRGAPGWHLECSVMSMKYLGEKFDIHTGGIDHREVHHPNEIAQNQAFTGCKHSGANFWMHNNFLVARNDDGAGSKMSKSSGEFLRLQLLIDRGYHPLAYRLMCLQAHYRSELEFSWDSLGAALVRLKRLVMAIGQLKQRAGDAGAAQQISHQRLAQILDQFDAAISDDLNTAKALPLIDDILAQKRVDAGERLAALAQLDRVLGLKLTELTREDLRLRPQNALVARDEIEQLIEQRKAARADKDFARSDAIREHLAASGVELMDGDPLGWDWIAGFTAKADHRAGSSS